MDALLSQSDSGIANFRAKIRRCRRDCQKIISAAGIASRRAAEKLIEEGRVSVNGQTVTELGTKADPDVDDIRVDERRVKRRAAPSLLPAQQAAGLCHDAVRSRNSGRPCSIC